MSRSQYNADTFPYEEYLKRIIYRFSIHVYFQDGRDATITHTKYYDDMEEALKEMRLNIYFLNLNDERFKIPSDIHNDRSIRLSGAGFIIDIALESHPYECSIYRSGCINGGNYKCSCQEERKKLPEAGLYNILSKRFSQNI